MTAVTDDDLLATAILCRQRRQTLTEFRSRMPSNGLPADMADQLGSYKGGLDDSKKLSIVGFLSREKDHGCDGCCGLVSQIARKSFSR